MIAVDFLSHPSKLRIETLIASNIRTKVMEMGEKVKDRGSGKDFSRISIPSSGHDKVTGIPVGKNPIFI